jgi:hypothetical protein
MDNKTNYLRIFLLIFFSSIPLGCLESGSRNGEIKEITITLYNFEISPATIILNKGDTVIITVVNNGDGGNLRGYMNST